MAIDSKSANLLLGLGNSQEENEFDSDDCSTGDEADIKNVSKSISKLRIESGGSKDEDLGNYHKMREIETRTYQVELLNMARERNVIICLPTGSGKTFIALKLTEEMLPQAIERGQKIVFLANNVPLVQQQAKYFSSNLVNTCLKDDKYVRAISGDLNVDIWKEEQWNEILKSHHILVMSTQIFLDAITKAYVKWSQVALLILDECHHAQKDHPMAILMRNYGEKKDAGVTELPKILGLTATIIKGQSKEEKIPRDIETIESLLRAKAVTHRDYEEVLKHSTSNIIKPVFFHSDYSTDDDACQDLVNFMDLLDMLPKNFASEDEISIIESINHPSLTSEDQIYNKHKGVPKTLKANLNDLVKTYVELGPYCGRLAAIFKLVSIIQWIQEMDDLAQKTEDSDSGEDNEEDESEEAGVLTILYAAKTAVTQFMKRLEILMENTIREAKLKPGSNEAEAHVIRHCASKKVLELRKILILKSPGKVEASDELCGLIFCQRRMTAQVLRWYLETAAKVCPSEMGFIKPELMIGHSTIVQNTEVSRFTAKRQTDIIKKFHEKKLNVLVATQVVEEGLNVPACNLVIRFDPVLSYPSLVQSIGRARRKGAICYTLIENSESEKELKKIRDYINYNQKLALALEMNALHVGDDDDDNYNNSVDQNLIPPFCPTKDPNGPIITATDSISIIHRYCSALSCDKLASLIPTAFWKQKDTRPPQYKGFVLLPILSPVRDVVEGEWMPDKTLAKRSAYLEACKKLYYAGELTDNLLPKPRSIDNYKCEFLENLDQEFKEEQEVAPAKVGTRKRVQWYHKKVPEEIINSFIRPGMSVSAYEISIKLKEYTGPDEFKDLYDFDKYGLKYGLLTNADLEQIPRFVLLAHYGKIEVSVKKCMPEVTLTSAEILALQEFNQFLLKSIYWSNNPAIKLESHPSILVAPFRIDQQNKTLVDWGLVDKLNKIDDNQFLVKPTDEAREKMSFNPASYENAVVVPWYKDDPVIELFCTIKTLLDCNALSQFDEPKKFATFKEYFDEKHGVQLYHPDHPLLLCKSVGKQLNFLSSKIDAKILRRDLLRSKVKMIPELVNIHALPGSLYVQGRYLPSILHRISRLLLANEIRLKIALYFDWNIEGSKDDSCLEPYTDEGDPLDGLHEGIKQLPSPPPEKKADKPKAKKDIILWETLNPMEISWDQIIKSPGKKNVRDSKFAMPQPPTYKSMSVDDLIPIDQITFKSFDKRINFDVEKGPQTSTLMEALTLSNAQDSCSLERLEVIGDSVLKLVTSLHIFRSFTTWDEGKMTLLRMKLISNRHLYQHGKKKGIHELLSGSIFIPAKSWLPAGFSVWKNAEEFVLSKQLDYSIFNDISPDLIEANDFHEQLNDDFIKDHIKRARYPPHTSFTHSRIGDKSIADAVEALMGAYYMNGGIDGALRCMEWLGLRGPLEDGSCVVYSRDNSLAPLPAGSFKTGEQHIIPLLKDLEEILCYTFKNPWIAVEALTHPTYMGNRQTSCYERLEFVGDAILDFLVTDYILNKTNITDPGKITDLRSALVNNVTFGSLAVRYGFHTLFKYTSETLGNYITKFVQFQEENNHEISDPYELLNDFDCPTVREIEIPKVLGDLFESIAGAVFVDSGMSIDTVWRVFYRLMKKELEKFSKNIPKSPLRQLYERFPGKGNVKFMKLADTKENSKDKQDKVVSKFQAVFLKVPTSKVPIVGVGSNLKQAKLAAAKYVVKQWKSQ